jgi:hypothetical protein
MEYKGYTIELTPDSDPENPQTEWDNFTKIWCFHRRYNLGNKHHHKFDDFNDWNEFEDHIKKEHDAFLIYKVYAYIHSGITLSINRTGQYADQWDSCTVGLVFCTKADIRECYMKKYVTKKLREKAIDLIKSEIEIYDMYLNIWNLKIIDPNGEEIENVCGGYDYNECLKEAEHLIDNDLKELPYRSPFIPTEPAEINA